MVDVVDVSEITDGHLEIDLEKRTWSYGERKDIPIGIGRIKYAHGIEIKEGIIGIYDRNSTKQLSSMTGSAIIFTRSTTGSYDYL